MEGVIASSRRRMGNNPGLERVGWIVVRTSSAIQDRPVLRAKFETVASDCTLFHPGCRLSMLSEPDEGAAAAWIFRAVRRRLHKAPRHPNLPRGFETTRCIFKLSSTWWGPATGTGRLRRLGSSSLPSPACSCAFPDWQTCPVVFTIGTFTGTVTEYDRRAT